MEKLKPCPFCGKKPSIRTSHSKTVLIHKCEVMDSNLGYGKKQELIDKWNTRQDDWIPVSEKLPEIGQYVLVHIPYNPVIQQKTPNDVRMVTYDGKHEYYTGFRGRLGGLNVTQWKPITPPKELHDPK